MFLFSQVCDGPTAGKTQLRWTREAAPFVLDMRPTQVQPLVMASTRRQGHFGTARLTFESALTFLIRIPRVCVRARVCVCVCVISFEKSVKRKKK